MHPAIDQHTDRLLSFAVAQEALMLLIVCILWAIIARLLCPYMQYSINRMVRSLWRWLIETQEPAIAFCIIKAYCSRERRCIRIQD